jgi:septal ring factor EnvC (AmiA/AmiB activator)
MSGSRISPKRILFAVLAILCLYAGNSQSNEQKNLELKKERLQREIREINRLLFAEQKQKGSVLDQMEALEQKINRQQQLIRVTNQQSNLLNRQINTNVRNMDRLLSDLELLKADYAKMIQKSYKNRLGQNKLLFLLSSSSWLQAYQRLNYMKQYAEFRRKQGLEIQFKSSELSALNEELEMQRESLLELLAENRRGKDELEAEAQKQKELLKAIRQNESAYAAEIATKQKEAKAIDNQIERLIRAAITASNKASSAVATSSERFALTPEATLIANNFSANKGRLIWPVEKGIKKQGYGIYQDPVYPGIKHQSNGVIIATDPGARARSVFEGEVIAILAVPGGNKGVQIKHGNYISTYYNLSEVFVKKGDKVQPKTDLGKINTNGYNGITQLKFYLYKDTNRLNPEEWIFQL